MIFQTSSRRKDSSILRRMDVKLTEIRDMIFEIFTTASVVTKSLLIALKKLYKALVAKLFPDEFFPAITVKGLIFKSAFFIFPKFFTTTFSFIYSFSGATLRIHQQNPRLALPWPQTRLLIPQRSQMESRRSQVRITPHTPPPPTSPSPASSPHTSAAPLPHPRP